jgi:hypothetical protein
VAAVLASNIENRAPRARYRSPIQTVGADGGGDPFGKGEVVVEMVESRDREIERGRRFWLAILKTEVHGLGIDWGCKPK